MDQFAQCDRRDAQSVRLRVEPCACARGTVAQHANTNIRVEHEPSHLKTIPGPEQRVDHDPGNRHLESRRNRPKDSLIAFVRAEAAQPFDLARKWPLRASAVRVADAETAIILTIHHIAADAWSLG